MLAPQDRIIAARPCMVLAYADSAHAALCCRQFRRQGWEVHLANSGAEARRLTRLLHPAVVVLHTELSDESGWLTCDKLVNEMPGQKVILVGENLTPACFRFAEFVGASGLVARCEGVRPLLDEVLGVALPATG